MWVTVKVLQEWLYCDLILLSVTVAGPVVLVTRGRREEMWHPLDKVMMTMMTKTLIMEILLSSSDVVNCTFNIVLC